MKEEKQFSSRIWQNYIPNTRENTAKSMQDYLQFIFLKMLRIGKICL